MLDGGFRRLPVVEDDRLVGIVSVRTLLGALHGGAPQQPGGGDEGGDPAPADSSAQVRERPGQRALHAAGGESLLLPLLHAGEPPVKRAVAALLLRAANTSTAACVELLHHGVALLSRMAAGWDVASSRAKVRMSSAGMPVISAAHSGVRLLARAASSA